MLHFQPMLASDFYWIGVMFLMELVLAPSLALVAVSLITALVPALRPSIRGLTSSVLSLLLLLMLLGLPWSLSARAREPATELLILEVPLIVMALLTGGFRWLGVALLKRQKRPTQGSHDSISPRSRNTALSVLCLTAAGGAIVWVKCSW